MGETIVRPAGHWTPAVHALLTHLEKVGFAGAPRVVSVNSESEILTYVPGDTPEKGALEWFDEEVLVSVGELLRRYHDAVASFTPPVWAHWRQTSGPTAGTLVCHNDLCLGNVVFHGGTAFGIIDFDFAHPAEPLWDVAVAAWHWLPLSTDDEELQSTWPARLRLFVDAYGIAADRRREVLFVIADLTRRMRSNRARDGQPTGTFDRALDALERQRTALRDALG